MFEKINIFRKNFFRKNADFTCEYKDICPLFIPGGYTCTQSSDKGFCGNYREYHYEKQV